MPSTACVRTESAEADRASMRSAAAPPLCKCQWPDERTCAPEEGGAKERAQRARSRRGSGGCGTRRIRQSVRRRPENAGSELQAGLRKRHHPCLPLPVAMWPSQLGADRDGCLASLRSHATRTARTPTPKALHANAPAPGPQSQAQIVDRERTFAGQIVDRAHVCGGDGESVG